MWFFGTTPIKYMEERDEMSRHAVVLFFVLSGYLITYLLMIEKEKFDKIDIRNFYKRRILRIWPLYYVSIILALLVVPFNTFGHDVQFNLEGITLYALFIPNFALMAGYMIPSIAPLWSVGVEEQFYAVWPIFINHFKSIIGFLLLFLFSYVGLKVCLLLTGNVWSKFSINLNFFSYDTMAIGGIAAWLYHKGHKILKILYHPTVQVTCWAFFGISCIAGPLEVHYIINKEVYSIAFAVIILNTSTNPRSLITLKNRWFDFMGKLSYGMYVLHPFVILLVSIPLKHIVPLIPGKPFQFLLIIAFVYPITILAATISYKYFELKFLRLKEQYAKIPSTQSAVETIEPLPIALKELRQL